MGVGEGEYAKNEGWRERDGQSERVRRLEYGFFLILHEKVRMLPEQLIGGHGSTEAKERERERGREKDVEKIKVDTEGAKIH